MVSLPISEENPLNHNIHWQFPQGFHHGMVPWSPRHFFFISRSQLLFRCYQEVLNSLTRFYSQLRKPVLGYHTPTGLFWTPTWPRQVTSCLYPPRGWYRAAAAGTGTESPRLFPYMGQFQRKKGKTWPILTMGFWGSPMFRQNNISPKWMV